MKLDEHLAVAAELCGCELSELAARIMLKDLGEYPEAAVHKALVRVRKEHHGRLTLAAIVSRIDDGRPGPDEAWSQIPKSEMETAAVSREMSEALRVAQPLIDSGDMIAARMAFRDAYQRACSDARAEQRPVEWGLSLGWDSAGRVAPILDAVEAGRISQMQALEHVSVPEHREAIEQAAAKHDKAIASNVKAAIRGAA